MQPRMIVLTAGLMIGCSIALPAGAQSVDDARELYVGAAYIEALEVLDAVEKKTSDQPARREALQYRALCLLALSRSREAEQTVARLVDSEPMYAPDPVEAPPQLRELFKVVRERKLPSMVREKFTAARQSFARNRPAEAAAGFDAVLTLLDTPEVQSALGADAVADMRTLANGFRDLAKTPAPSAVPPPVPEPSAAMKTGIAAAPNLDAITTPAPPRQPEIFGVDHPDVVPPVALRQAFPSLRPQWTVTAARGLVEVVIAADGAVESAKIRRPIHPVYDRMLLDEARAWRYSPATRNGVAVRYRKLIEVVVQR